MSVFPTEDTGANPVGSTCPVSVEAITPDSQSGNSDAISEQGIMKGYTIYKKLKIEIEKVVAGRDAHLCNELADKEYEVK